MALELVKLIKRPLAFLSSKWKYWARVDLEAVIQEECNGIWSCGFFEYESARIVRRDGNVSDVEFSTLNCLHLHLMVNGRPNQVNDTINMRTTTG